MKYNMVVKIGAVAGILACFGEFAVEAYAAYHYPGYSTISQSISRLGAHESPFYSLITGWSLVFSFLISLFAIGFWIAFKSAFSGAKLASLLIIVYGLGEGFVAGIFPMDTTTMDKIDLFSPHNISSGIGVFCLVLLPLVVRPLFRHKDKKGEIFTFLVLVFGLLFVILFLLAKFGWFPSLVPFKGLWQRLFQIIYFGYIILLALRMIKIRQ